MGRIVNRSELAETFGVALSTADLWIQQGMPCQARPERRGGSGYKIDLSAVLEWHRERERQNALGEIAKVDEQEARRRKIAAEAALVEHELALKQGGAAAIADSESAWAAMIAAARAKLHGAGNKLGPIVAALSDAAECQAAIDEVIYQALQELSGFDSDELIPKPSEGASQPPASDPPSGPRMGAAAPAHRKPMGRREAKTKRRGKR
jgi:hypothetical protein